MSDIRAEMMPDELPDRSEVSKFDHSKLKHVNVTEKVILPSKEGRPRSGFFYLSFVLNELCHGELYLLEIQQKCLSVEVYYAVILQSH